MLDIIHLHVNESILYNNICLISSPMSNSNLDMDDKEQTAVLVSNVVSFRQMDSAMRNTSRFVEFPFFV